ncbi:hypothetical protein NV379_02305 [Paenibacillus sp. N1-5-1-14]|uniref:hypothetical protein n=1 Tax=Paenibacillus radicibacter TaxID=2972488 RepID=UPI0021599E7B|nr:hypothetical protein [Paenibacillus radicibacter]MCR8641479.1 hypothetical protein [Paenibacillus radicibacter]
MGKVIDTEWGKLSDPVKTILERIDINRSSADIRIGEVVDIPYFKGIFTEEMSDEILKYQHSSENEGFYSAQQVGEIVHINFLKAAF